MAPLLTRKKVLSLKIEGTKGTAETSGLSNLLVWDASISRADNFVERKYSSAHLGHTEPGVFERMYPGTCSFKTELTGTGAGDYNAALSIALQACGMSLTSKVFTPVSTAADQDTATIFLFEDGRLKSLYGAVGNFTLSVDAGRVIVEFEFSGIYDSVATQALPSVTYNVRKGLPWNGATFSLGTSTALISTFTFSPNNTIIPRMNAGAIDFYMVSDRDPTITVDPEAETPGDYDLYGLMEAHTTQALSLAIADSSDTITLAGSKVQFKEAESGDRGGIMTDKVTAIFTATSGDDEFTITAAATGA